MSNPYSQPSISGYNASPPADDGSAAASNQLEWQKHIDKIGDPLRTFMLAVDSAALAAHALAFGASVLAKTANYTVAASDRGRFITVTGTSTITLLDAASAGDGFPLLVVNIGSGVVTIDGDTSETINGNTSILLAPNDCAILTCNGTSWAAGGNYYLTGSFTPNYSSGFSADPSGDINYVLRGNMATMTFPASTGTSDATGFAIDNIPAAIFPSAAVRQQLALIDNGSPVIGSARFLASSSITFASDGENGTFTASGSKGFPNNYKQMLTYPVKGLA